MSVYVAAHAAPQQAHAAAIITPLASEAWSEPLMDRLLLNIDSPLEPNRVEPRLRSHFPEPCSSRRYKLFFLIPVCPRPAAVSIGRQRFHAIWTKAVRICNP
jgi:hypothetical protein